MNEQKDVQNLKARKFLIWLIMATSFMLVAALTSVFIVSTSGEENVHTRLPYVFIISTALIIASSYTLHIAGKKLKGLQFDQYHLYLKITIALGVVFMILQVVAWVQLIGQKIYFDMHKSYQSFIYVFVAVHLLHILSGIGLLIYTLSGSLKNKALYRINLRNEVSTIFWHFIDGLWIYLYLFLLIK